MKHQGTAAICPACDALCVTAAEQERREEIARQRSRPLRDELGTVMRYPLSDPVAFVMLALVVWLFTLASQVAAFGGAIGLLFSQGLLYAYSFNAINRVSSGHLQGFMPEISDMTDLVHPVRLGLAAMIVSSGPLLLLLFLIPAVMFLSVVPGVGHDTPAAESGPAAPALPSEQPVAATEEEGVAAEETPVSMDEGVPSGYGPPLWAFAALPLALLWTLVYSPMALIAAAISRSFLKTLNPLVGIDCIRRMGSVYWESMGVYTAIAIAQFLLGALLGLVPFAGGLLNAFVGSYAFLAIGCLLGFAVFKRARELGVE